MEVSQTSLTAFHEFDKRLQEKINERNEIMLSGNYNIVCSAQKNNIQKRNKRVMMSNGKSELNLLSIQNH